jgi:hypothetical protein
LFRIQLGGKMKITVMTGLPAKGDMYVDSGQCCD